MSKIYYLPTLLAAFLLTFAADTRAADHLDAPNVMADGSTDINDLYAYQSPANPNNTVLIMTVNPGAGAISGQFFNTGANYTFNIDNDGDAVADVTYNATFGPIASLAQAYTITRNGAAYTAGVLGTTTTGAGNTSTAGIFEDPFFFDLNGFNDGLNFTGDDFFAGLDVSAIVLEVPSSELNGADSNIGIWATTSDSGGQIDRIGRPAINTVLIPSARKDEFNEAAPAGDFGTFGADVQATIEALNGGDSTHASTVTSILLPDVLTFDTSNAGGFLNGRQLADDVIDAELTLLTNSSTPIGDGVDTNDVAFPGAFPYLAAANNALVPEPTSVALLGLGITALGLGRRRKSA
ncbi:DUF4331 family protein [Adhaeretor mobilis]|uniref:Ice-binding protein C-terminal domain-containing protein n=1 Tax=Adhaeretor mobilis TaxID=1930276 RepID=A0A517MQD7_9BACT|nr:DUF4331 family protein [Adhaeretor mobilis]QDS97096.1 hypothetical protein HG15A2_03560 [Adhaeretor mobilis]